MAIELLPDGTPIIALMNEARKARVLVTVRPDGDGRLSVYDREGRRRLGSP